LIAAFEGSVVAVAVWSP